MKRLVKLPALLTFLFACGDSAGKEDAVSLEERAVAACRQLEDACPKEFSWAWGDDRPSHQDACVTRMTEHIGDFCATGSGHSHPVGRLGEVVDHCAGTERIYCGPNRGGCEAALVDALVDEARNACTDRPTVDSYEAIVWSRAGWQVESTCCD